MSRAVDGSLEALGLEGHEVLIVARDDTRPPHVHVIANRVDPETGKAAKLGNRDFGSCRAGPRATSGNRAGSGARSGSRTTRGGGQASRWFAICGSGRFTGRASAALACSPDGPGRGGSER